MAYFNYPIENFPKGLCCLVRSLYFDYLTASHVAVTRTISYTIQTKFSSPSYFQVLQPKHPPLFSGHVTTTPVDGKNMVAS